MTYDPYRNATKPQDPYPDYNRDMAEGGTGAAILLAALVLLALGGFIYYYAGSDDTSVATKDMRAPITQPNKGGAETTGSGSATPIPPNPPARPSQ